MSYAISILKRAQRELEQLPKQAFEEVRDGIRRLANNPRPQGCKKLIDRQGWRIRINDYRVIYEIDDPARKVTVLHVGNRRDVYK